MFYPSSPPFQTSMNILINNTTTQTHIVVCSITCAKKNNTATNAVINDEAINTMRDSFFFKMMNETNQTINKPNTEKYPSLIVLMKENRVGTSTIEAVLGNDRFNAVMCPLCSILD